MSVNEIKQLIEKGADINAKGANGRTPLMFALEYRNDINVIKFLINNGANVNEKNSDINYYEDYDISDSLFPEYHAPIKGLMIEVNTRQEYYSYTPLMIATEFNKNPDVIRLVFQKSDLTLNQKLIYGSSFMSVDEIKQLINKGADVNAKDKNGRTSLMFATINDNNPNVVKFLIDKDNNFKSNYYYSLSVLNFAAKNSDNPDVIKLLIDNRAPKKTKYHDWITPLMLAAKYNNNPKIIKLLIDNGEDVNSKNKLDQTPLMVIAFNKNVDIVKALIEKGNIIKFINGKPLFIYALEYNENPDVIKLLKGDDPFFYSHYDYGNKVVDYAMKNYKSYKKIFKIIGYDKDLYSKDFWKTATPEIVKEKIEQGADIHLTTKNAVTPLMYAAENTNNPKVVKLLIKYGDYLNAVDKNGNKVADYAKQNKKYSKKIFKMLGYDKDLYSKDFWKTATPKIVKEKIEQDTYLNAKDKNNITPLMYAVEYNKNPEVIKLLINNGANVNAKVDFYKITTLMYAVRYCINPEIIKLLIDKGASINTKDDLSMTPLMYAAKWNKNPEIIKLLIDKGADVNAKVNYYRTTPLMYAVEYNKNPEVIKILISNGANVNAKDKDGNDIIFYAKKNKNKETKRKILDILKKYFNK